MLKKAIAMILIMMIIVNCTITTSQAVFSEMLNLKSTLSVRATAKTGKTEDGLEYEVLSDGTGVSITDYTGTQTEVVIPGTIGELPVLEIGSYAFASCSSLTSITIPDSVTRIGISAFSGCSSLTAIMVEEANIKFVSIDGVLYDKEKTELYCYPAGKRETSYAILEGVERIRVYAFRECSNLIDVIIPKSVIEIESNAFIDCSGLINITLPESLRIIGKGAFLGCSSLTSITIPDRVSYIWDSVFLGCASLVEINVEEKNNNYVSIEGVLYNKEKTLLHTYPSGKNETSYEIQEGVTSIGVNAFNGCSNLTNITIPEGVTSIGEEAFYKCGSLTSIIIPEGVTSIGDWAFTECSSLTSIVISEGVTNIGEKVFYGCSSLAEIKVEETNNNYVSVDGVLFDKDKTVLIAWPAKKEADSFITPSTLKEIASYAFSYVSDLKKLVISGNVEKIHSTALFNAYGIREILFEEGVTTMPVLSGMTSLTEIIIPTTVTKLEGRVFEACVRLQTIVIPKSVTYIDKEIFNNGNFIGGEALGERTIICADNSVAKEFAIENNIKYQVDNTYPTIEGIENGKNYEETAIITPVIKDDNLKVVYLYKNGNKVSDYKSGDSITGSGAYELIAKDIVGNETQATIEINNISKNKGDINEDSKIDIVDVLILLRHNAATKSEKVKEKHPDWCLAKEKIIIADVNEDNDANIVDVLILLRHNAASKSESVREKHPDWKLNY